MSPSITCSVTCSLPTNAANYEGKAYIEAVVAVAPEAEAVPPSELRRRPLIFVYDLPPEYVARMLQYKVHRWGGTQLQNLPSKAANPVVLSTSLPPLCLSACALH